MYQSTNFKYPELLNVPFSYNEKDCLWIVTEYYKKEYDIQLMDFARYEGWEYDGHNFFVDNYRKFGFEFNDIDGDWSLLREGDVLLMAIYNYANMKTNGNANHCAVYLGGGLMLHSRFGNYSKIERVKKSMVTHTLRHKELKSLKKPVETLDYLATLPEDKQKAIRDAIERTKESLQ